LQSSYLLGTGSRNLSKAEEVQEIKADVKELVWVCGFTQPCQFGFYFTTSFNDG